MTRAKVQLFGSPPKVVVIETDATKGATIGLDLRGPNGQVLTLAQLIALIGGGTSGGGGSGSGPDLNSILTTKGDLVTRDTAVQRLPIGAAGLTLNVVGGLPAWSVAAVVGGGTGINGYAAGDILYANSTTTLAKRAIGTAGDILKVNSGAPAWVAPAALTKTDDTNVTATLGGSHATALVNAASITLGWTGQLSAPRGGTGIGSYTLGDLLYATGVSALGKLAIGSAGYVLKTTAGAPSWEAPAALTKTDDTNVTLTLGGSAATALLNAASLTLGWTGTLAPTRGGTGFGSYTVGDILYANTTSTLAKLGVGASNDVLTIVGGVPTWAAPSGGVSGANPTATIGLSAVNGSATTYLRSDGAPALSQSIVPTWTGQHKFTGTETQLINAGTSGDMLALIAAGRGTNDKAWVFRIGGSGNLQIDTGDDSGGAQFAAWAAQRTGLTITTIEYGNPTDLPSHTFRGIVSIGNTGTVSVVDFNSSAAGGCNTRYQRSSTTFADIGSGSQVTAGGTTDGLGIGTRANFPIEFSTNGTRKLILTGDGRLYGSALHNNAGAVTGTTNQYIASGTYTPTGTNVANAGSLSMSVAQWMRVGNVVTVSGRFTFTASASANTTVGASLPIASAFATAGQLAGAFGYAISVGVFGGPISTDTTNDRAQFDLGAIAAAAAVTVHYTYTYLVV